MKRDLLTGQRLIAAFCLGVLILNYPLLTLFNRPRLIGGVPLLVLYLFAAWALLIGLFAWIIARPRR